MPGVRVLRIDPLMLLATLGIVAASIYTVATATSDDIPGDANYFVGAPGGLCGASAWCSCS